MPEIKNTFARGKMNKDLDERIIPSGEYRDAMNVQVSTSEAADVGTVQNILGNARVENVIGGGWNTVGTIADEKNNKLYWLVHNPNRDAIFEYNLEDNTTVPVLIDTNMDVLKFDGNIITGINIVDDILMWTDNVNEPRKININRCKLGSPLHTVHTSLVVNGEGVLDKEIQVVVSVDSVPVPPSTAAATNIIEFSDTSQLTVGDQLISLQTSGGGIWNFITSPSGGPQLIYITAINGSVVTLSDVIFTGGTANWIIGNQAVFHHYVDITEEHITVIKKKPITAPKIEVVRPTGQDILVATCEFSQNNAGNYLLQPGDVAYIRVPRVPSGILFLRATYDWTAGTNLLLSQTTTSGSLPINQEARCKVLSVVDTVGNPGYTTWEVELISINNSIPTTITTFDGNNIDSGLEMHAIKEFDIEKKLFENKFVRFATRWKYEDGEYSAFSPFSDVAFNGSRFAFHPTKTTYNLGMENNCDEVELTHLVTPDMPEDVVQIDILFKLENSTTIYSLESIKPNDPLPPGESYNSWNKDQNPSVTILSPSPVTIVGISLPTSYQGQYIVSTENIYAALPSNQLLRPWDNVPKKALAQEITGNRIVYGNYTQGYNMLDGAVIAKPYLELGYRQRSFLDGDNVDFQFGQRSLKTFRTYQLGVVYGDEYGRETPVFTSQNASFKIPWDSDNAQTFNGNASRSVQLTAVLRGTHPDFAKYYKFFIKQNSGEYYNLSMDRVYRAEDNQNLWISFPSSDANKVQKDEYIVLKKQAETEQQVETNNKYKVIDIKNEVPDYVKFKYIEVGHVGGSTLVSTLFTGYSTGVNIPTENQNQIDIDVDVWKNNGGSALEDQKELLELQFTKVSGASVIESQRYRIVGIDLQSSDSEYKITLDKLITTADNWVTTTPTSDVVDDDLRIKILKLIPKSSAEFEGRFFVKIISDNTTQTYLEPLINQGLTYKVAGTVQSHYFADIQAAPGATHEDGIVNSNNTTTHPGSEDTNYIHALNKSNTREAWEELFKYGTGSIKQGWFIDHCYFASGQEVDSSDKTGQTGLLRTDRSGRMMRGGGSTGATGQYLVDSAEGIIDLGGASPGGITAYKSGTDPIDQNSGWGGRSWHYRAKSPGNLPPYGSGAGDNSFDNIYAGVNPSTSRYFMHMSFGPVGDNLWVKQSGYGGLGYITNSDFDWQYINPGDFGHGSYLVGAPHPDQWTIKDNDQKIIADKLIAGSKFKFLTNEEVFTILKVSVKRLYNHTPFIETQQAWDGTVGIDLNNSVEYAWDELDAAGWNSTPEQEDLADKIEAFGHKSNRRLLYIIELDKNPHDYGITYTWDVNSTHNIRFIEAIPISGESAFVTSPAIWETEQKDDVDLDIYYEASDSIPIRINAERENSEVFAPVGSEVWCSKSGSMPLFTGLAENMKLIVTDWESAGTTYNQVEFASPGLKVNPSGGALAFTNDQAGWDAQTTEYTSKTLRFFKPDGSFVSASISAVKEIIGNYITKVTIFNSGTGKMVGLSHYDCFCFGNGVESNRIRDDFNAMVIGKGVKASAILEQQYKEEHRKYGLIYSGLYNSTSGVNNLNQFIQAEKITKDLNPTYGSIQKLFQRRINLVAFCEDRVIKIIANKDALYNADGKPQLISTNKVLGDANPFVGDYGISTNPESFAKESYRAYFSDKQRGAILRLSMDGMTPISDAGMSDYFKDNLRNAETIVGNYDNNKKNYNITLKSETGETNIGRGEGSLEQIGRTGSANVEAVTISYDEKVKGWCSFKSFIPDTGISVSNNYYTFNDGRLWQHHVEEFEGAPVNRNVFYGDTLVPSRVTIVLNEQPQAVKSFNTLNYEGDAGWVGEFIRTDQQTGTVNEFIEKEGKWFNYIRGEAGIEDLQAFNFQGIGQTVGIEYNII